MMATTTLQNAATTDGNGTAATGLTGPATVGVSVVDGNMNGAAVRFEFSFDGTTWFPVSWVEPQTGNGGVTIDVKGTWQLRAPVYGTRTGQKAITVVASYA